MRGGGHNREGPRQDMARRGGGIFFMSRSKKEQEAVGGEFEYKTKKERSDQRKERRGWG